MAQMQSIETISEIVVQKNVDYNAEKDLKKQFSLEHVPKGALLDLL